MLVLRRKTPDAGKSSHEQQKQNGAEDTAGLDNAEAEAQDLSELFGNGDETQPPPEGIRQEAEGSERENTYGIASGLDRDEDLKELEKLMTAEEAGDLMERYIREQEKKEGGK